MKCPKCASNKMDDFNTSEGVVVNFCESCCSIWFEKDELAFYVETTSDLPLFKESLAIATPSNFNCTICEGNPRMLQVPYHIKEDLMVDYCSKCHGLLLESKELIKVEKLVYKYKLTNLQHVIKILKEKGYSVL